MYSADSPVSSLAMTAFETRQLPLRVQTPPLAPGLYHFSTERSWRTRRLLFLCIAAEQKQQHSDCFMSPTWETRIYSIEGTPLDTPCLAWRVRPVPRGRCSPSVSSTWSAARRWNISRSGAGCWPPICSAAAMRRSRGSPKMSVIRPTPLSSVRSGASTAYRRRPGAAATQFARKRRSRIALLRRSPGLWSSRRGARSFKDATVQAS
jgi:hypothetical protein